MCFITIISFMMLNFTVVIVFFRIHKIDDWLIPNFKAVSACINSSSKNILTDNFAFQIIT